MDSKEQAVDTICFLIAPNKLNEFQLEILSAISITLLEPLSRDIYCFANRENVYTFLEGKLELVYKTLLEKIWRN